MGPKNVVCLPFDTSLEKTNVFFVDSYQMEMGRDGIRVQTDGDKRDTGPACVFLLNTI